jgi:hypothetical protein
VHTYIQMHAMLFAYIAYRTRTIRVLRIFISVRLETDKYVQDGLHHMIAECVKCGFDTLNAGEVLSNTSNNYTNLRLIRLTCR